MRHARRPRVKCLPLEGSPSAPRSEAVRHVAVVSLDGAVGSIPRRYSAETGTPESDSPCREGFNDSSTAYQVSSTKILETTTRSKDIFLLVASIR